MAHSRWRPGAYRLTILLDGERMAVHPRTVHDKEATVDRDHLDAMTEATALPRAGRLAEATALIQRTLAGDHPVRVVQGDIVVDEERLRDDPPARSGRSRWPRRSRRHARPPGPEVRPVDA